MRSRLRFGCGGGWGPGVAPLKGPSLALALALACAGCGLFGHLSTRLPPATADDLLHSLASRRAAVSGLRARARIRNGVASLWTHEAVLVQRPRTLRIDVLSPFGLAMALGTDGVVLWAYPPQERVRYEGPASPENLARVLGATIAIDDLVDVLLGLPPAREPVAPPLLETTPDREYLLTVPLRDGTQKLWFQGDPLTLVRTEESHTDRAAVRVAFGEHEAGFPHTIQVLVPATDVTVTLHYDQIELNPVLDPSGVTPPPAPAVRPLPGPRG